MEDSVMQLVVDHLQKYQKIGIFIPMEPSIDAVAAASALASGLSALGKTITIVSEGHVPESTQFLPHADRIAPLHIDTSHLIVQLDTTATQLAELSYETIAGKVRIFLRPKEGRFFPEDVTVQAAEFPFELIILCGVQRPEQLGRVFADNVELFYSLPRINLDVHPENEAYGTINIVSVTASAVSELVFRVLNMLDEVVSVPPAATALLLGVFAATDQLRGPATTPHTFAVVADLVAAGAAYRDVVRHLVRVDRLGALQLLGRVLARLRAVAAGEAVYAVLHDHDLEKTGETTPQVQDLLVRMRSELPQARVLCLVIPKPDATSEVAILCTYPLKEERLQAALSLGEWRVHSGSGMVWATVAVAQSVDSVETIVREGLERLVRD